MAAVALTRVFLSLADDPAQVIAAFSADPSEREDIDGAVESYGDRRRIVLGDDEGRTLQRTLRLLTPAQVALLRSWKGRALLLRDKKGRKAYGTFFQLQVVDYVDRDSADVSLTFIESSFDEAV